MGQAGESINKGENTNTIIPDAKVIESNTNEKLIPAWQRGVYRGFRWFSYVALVTIFWILVSYLDVLPYGLSSSVNLVLPILLFLLAIPISIIFGLDNIIWESSGGNIHVSELLILLTVLINFLCISVCLVLVRGDSEKK